MAGEDDQIVIAIEQDDDAGAGGKTEPLRGEDGKFVAKEPAEDLAAQFAELQAKSQRDQQAIDTERRRAVAAEQEAVRARQEATTARGEVIDSQYGTVESGLSAAQDAAEAAEREYKTAFEAGDAAACAKAQRSIARAEATISRLTEAKSDLETRRAKAPTEADQVRTEPQRPVAHDDPVEAYVANRTPQTADWLRKHPEWVTDQRKNAKLTAAHYDATGDGLQPDTPEYFTHIEKFIGITKPNGKAPETRTRRATVPAAPVNGSGGGMSGGGGREVVLTRGEATVATDGTHVWNYDDPSPQKKFRKGDPIGVQEFARRKLAMTQQGMYDKSYTEA